MRKRQKNNKPYKKILLILASTLVGGVCLFLFYVGLSSLLSYLPIAAKDVEIEVLEVTGKTATLIEIKNLLASSNIKSDEVRESSRSAVIHVKLKDGPEIYFSKTKDAAYQVNSLQLILSKLTIDNKKPSTIDLRYARPIVKF